MTFLFITLIRGPSSNEGSALTVDHRTGTLFESGPRTRDSAIHKRRNTALHRWLCGAFHPAEATPWDEEGR